MRRSTLLKIVLGLAALALFGVLFVRSARNTAAQPYTMERAQLDGWVVALDPAPDASGVVLGLRPPGTLAPPLFNQIFSRVGLTLNQPDPLAMPLVLNAEFDRPGMAGALPLDALEDMARASGLQSTPPLPTCLAHRRISQPGSTRDLFFLRFEFPPLAALRLAIAARLGPAAGFDPAGLSPIVIIAGTDRDFRSWLPLQGDATQDCVAPIVVQ